MTSPEKCGPDEVVTCGVLIRGRKGANTIEMGDMIILFENSGTKCCKHRGFLKKCCDFNCIHGLPNIMLIAEVMDAASTDFFENSGLFILLYDWLTFFFPELSVHFGPTGVKLLLQKIWDFLPDGNNNIILKIAYGS